MRKHMLAYVGLLLLALPLGAQQTSQTIVPDVEITVNGDTIVVNVEVMSDSVRLARIAIAVESIAEALAECGCMEQPTTSNVVRIGQGALVLAAFFIGLQLKGIKDNTAEKNSDPVSDTPSDGYPESE